MKKIVFIAALMLGALGAKAQDCETIMLPYFGGNADAMYSYPQEKLEWRCAFARAAFYVSDTVPAGAKMHSITEVVAKEDGKNLTADFRVDLTTLSYYAYGFKDIQVRYPKGNVTICFPTPSSEHPYLVLRSIDDMYAIADNQNKEGR